MFKCAQKTPLFIHQRQRPFEHLPDLGGFDAVWWEDAPEVIHGPHRFALVIDNLLSGEVDPAEVAVMVSPVTILKLQVNRSLPVGQQFGAITDVGGGLRLHNKCFQCGDQFGG